MLITLDEYLGQWKKSPDVTAEVLANATKLLLAVEELSSVMRGAGTVFPKNPTTRSCVSGSLYGGFRPKDCQVGALNSSHKKGQAVDLFDPQGRIDDWCLENQDKLEAFGIYLESPSATKGWSHWTIRRPGSGNRVFQP